MNEQRKALKVSELLNYKGNGHATLKYTTLMLVKRMLIATDTLNEEQDCNRQPAIT